MRPIKLFETQRSCPTFIASFRFYGMMRAIQICRRERYTRQIAHRQTAAFRRRAHGASARIPRAPGTARRFRDSSRRHRAAATSRGHPYRHGFPTFNLSVILSPATYRAFRRIAIFTSADPDGAREPLRAHRARGSPPNNTAPASHNSPLYSR